MAGVGFVILSVKAVEPFHAIEDNRKHVLPPHEVQCLLRGLRWRVLGPDYKQRGVGSLFPRKSVCQRSNRRRIDENPVETWGQRFHHCRQRSLLQKFTRVTPGISGRKEITANWFDSPDQ